MGDALRAAETRLADRGVPAPRLTAEVLLANVLGVDKAFLYAHHEEELSAALGQRLAEWVERRCEGVPTQYRAAKDDHRHAESRLERQTDRRVGSCDPGQRADADSGGGATAVRHSLVDEVQLAAIMDVLTEPSTPVPSDEAFPLSSSTYRILLEHLPEHVGDSIARTNRIVLPWAGPELLRAGLSPTKRTA